MAQRNYNTPYYQSLRAHSLKRAISKEKARIKGEKAILKLQDDLQTLILTNPIRDSEDRYWCEKYETTIPDGDGRDEKWG